MSDMRSYNINKPAVVGEVIDGELVAIHLESGCYYHANATGAVIWSYIEQGLGELEITAEMKKKYAIDEQRIEKDMHVFIERLLQEHLIRIADMETLPTEHVSQSSDVPATYEEPVLKKHEDMRELLLLDPIHDVGEGAWPMQEVK